MANHEFGSSTTKEMARLLSGSLAQFSEPSSTSSFIDKATKEASTIGAIVNRHSSGLTAAEEAIRLATGRLDPISKSVGGSLIDKGMADAVKEQRMVTDTALGLGSLSRAVDEMKTLRGMDADTLAGVKTRLGKFEGASAYLADELAKSRDRGPLGFTDAERYTPPVLPPTPRNPILKTNELLRSMVEELAEQRALVEVAAEAQQRETELLGKLVEVFMSSQAASDKATRRSHMQAWIGIGVAILTGFIPLVMTVSNRDKSRAFRHSGRRALETRILTAALEVVHGFAGC